MTRKQQTLQSFDKGKYHYEVFVELDDSPDMSYLGEYSNSPAKVHIDRQARGDMGHHEYRYFNLGCGDADYIEQDYRRYEQFNRGEWYMVGVVCEISVKTKSRWAIAPVVGRASVWGIESDSDMSYFEEVAKAQIGEAEADLKNLKRALCQ